MLMSHSRLDDQGRGRTRLAAALIALGGLLGTASPTLAQGLQNAPIKFPSLFRASSAEQRMYATEPCSGFRPYYNQIWNDGWRLSTLETFALRGQEYCTGTWRRTYATESQVFGWEGWSWAALSQEIQNAHAAGWRLRLFQPYVINNQVRYNVVWRPGTEAQYYRVGMDINQFLAAYGDFWNRNFRLQILHTYVLNGRVLFAGVWGPSSAGQLVDYFWSEGDFTTNYQQRVAQGWRLHDVTAVTVGGQILYTGVWNPGNGTNDRFFSEQDYTFRFRLAHMTGYVLHALGAAPLP
jgi:Bacterial tandem repeat domain 1